MCDSEDCEDVLTSGQVDRFRELLLEERQKLVDLYRRDVHAGRDLQAEGAWDAGDLAAMDDARDLLFSFSTSERDQLQEIDEALGRIEAGSYGLCQHDGEPIAVNRLQALPWARLCGEHQTMSEDGILE